MSASETADHDPERDRASASPAGGGVSDSPGQSPHSPPPFGTEPAGSGFRPTDLSAMDVPSPGSGWPARATHVAQSRKGAWAAVALLCVIVGSVASLLVAQSVAHNKAAEGRAAFQRSSEAIAASLKVAVQREEDLAVSASTFYAGNPQASHAEFEKWAKWARMLHHYPELEGLGLVAMVRAPELPAFEARTSGTAVTPAPTRTPATAASAQPIAGGLQIAPSGTRSVYCLTVAALARSLADAAPAGQDYCALTPALLSSRDSAVGSYAPVSAGRSEALGVETPVYRGGQPPSTVTGRRAAFVGWLLEVLAPRVVVQGVLRNHPESALRLRYRTGSADVIVTGGNIHSEAQGTKVDLHNGWTARIYGPPAATSVTADGQALALLIAGILLSVLLGMLAFVLGCGRSRRPAAKGRPARNEDLYDPLTGLPNRGLSLDRATLMVARATRQPGMLAGALLIDVDWFKDVNNKLGQAAGDQLLVIVAERLEGVVRAGDSVGRLQGDEFVILVESAARAARLDSLARRVIEALHKPVELDGFGPSFFFTASIGVAFGRYESHDDLLRDARLALYAAKAAGKDRYTLFNANMRSVIEGRGVLEVELNTALQDDQFRLLYEPIYDLGSRQVVGLEALVRWQHPEQGLLAPADFIPLAEENGLIVPIGRWMLEQACHRAAAWNVAGHRVGISVPVSANQLNRDGFATDVRRALQQSGIAPALLTLEISEATIMLDVAAAGERLAEIKQLGVRIAIDDFGSGYAYRSDLQRMPIDFLKVDRSSLAASDDEDYRSWLLEAILIFGRDLSLTVIAKGIESAEQLNTIQAMGCRVAQGAFMGEPATADAVEGLFGVELAAAAPAPAPRAVPATPVPQATPAPPVAPAAAAPAPPPAHAPVPPPPSSAPAGPEGQHS